MKNYLKPIVEVSKFDVEEIMGISDPVEPKSLIEAYNETAGDGPQAGEAAGKTVLTFEW